MKESEKARVIKHMEKSKMYQEKAMNIMLKKHEEKEYKEEKKEMKKLKKKVKKK